MIETKFINASGTIYEVVVYGDMAYPVGSGFKISEYEQFDTKIDAMYDKFLKDVLSGKPHTNYKVSKYYSMYIERLKKDHPEYLI